MEMAERIVVMVYGRSIFRYSK